MMRPPIEPGRVVISTAGHDKGRAFVVVGMPQEEYVLLCDGQTRRLDAPKKKKLKHVRAKPECFSNLLERLAMGRVYDSEIRDCLREAGYAQRAASGRRDEEA